MEKVKTKLFPLLFIWLILPAIEPFSDSFWSPHAMFWKYVTLQVVVLVVLFELNQAKLDSQKPLEYLLSWNQRLFVLIAFIWRGCCFILMFSTQKPHNFYIKFSSICKSIHFLGRNLEAKSEVCIEMLEYNYHWHPSFWIWSLSLQS